MNFSADVGEAENNAFPLRGRCLFRRRMRCRKRRRIRDTFPMGMSCDEVLTSKLDAPFAALTHSIRGKAASRFESRQFYAKNAQNREAFSCKNESGRALCLQVDNGFRPTCELNSQQVVSRVRPTLFHFSKKGHRKWCPFCWRRIRDSNYNKIQ